MINRYYIRESFSCESFSEFSHGVLTSTLPASRKNCGDEEKKSVVLSCAFATIFPRFANADGGSAGELENVARDSAIHRSLASSRTSSRLFPSFKRVKRPARYRRRNVKIAEMIAAAIIMLCMQERDAIYMHNACTSLAPCATRDSRGQHISPLQI